MPAAPQTPAQDALRPTEIHVWVVPLDDPDKRRRRALAQRAQLALLAAYLGRDPASLSITRQANGKPRLSDGALEFNLSHSAQLALVAVSGGPAVGVDVQAAHRTTHAPWFAQRICTARELRALGEGPPDPDLLLRLWVRKEAVIKARGEGSYVSVGEIDVQDDRLPDGLWCVDLPLPEHQGYRAALAARWVPGLTVSMRSFNPEADPRR